MKLRTFILYIVSFPFFQIKPVIQVMFNIKTNDQNQKILKQVREVCKADIDRVNRKSTFKYILECHATNGDFIRIIKKLKIDNKAVYMGFMKSMHGGVYRLYKPRDIYEEINKKAHIKKNFV